MQIRFLKTAINRLAALVLGLLLSYAGGAKASINTAIITVDTMQALPSCLHYKVIGICFWRSPTGIPFTTPKVSHYIPDLVVTVYNQVGDDPWTEVNVIYDQAAYKIGDAQTQSFFHMAMAGGQSSAGTLDNLDTRFKEADVIGNPVAQAVFGKALLLPSQATPFYPYYQSMLDTVIWRFPTLETLLYPQYLIPGLDDIGTWPLHTWGTVYPRTGFINQANDAKAAAVIALRAAHIVTRQHQPHFYTPLPSTCGQDCAAKKVTQNNDDTQWQMLSPIESNQCEVFGKEKNQAQWGIDAAKTAHGAYVFNVWRHYRGCVQGVGKYLYSMNFK